MNTFYYYIKEKAFIILSITKIYWTFTMYQALHWSPFILSVILWAWNWHYHPHFTNTKHGGREVNLSKIAQLLSNRRGYKAGFFHFKVCALNHYTLRCKYYRGHESSVCVCLFIAQSYNGNVTLWILKHNSTSIYIMFFSSIYGQCHNKST